MINPKYKIGERVVIWSLTLNNNPYNSRLKRFSKDNQEYFRIGQIITKNNLKGQKKIYYLLYQEKISSEIIEVDEEILATAYWAEDFLNIESKSEIYSSFEGEIIRFD